MSKLLTHYFVYEITIHIYGWNDRLWKFITLADSMIEALAIANLHIEESILDDEMRIERIEELETIGVLKKEG